MTSEARGSGCVLLVSEACRERFAATWKMPSCIALAMLRP